MGTPSDWASSASGSHVGCIVADIIDAVRDELAAVRSGPVQTYAMESGSRLARTTDGWMYRFDSEIAIPLQPETRIQVRAGAVGDWVAGTLLSAGDFHVLAELSEDIGEHIGSADLSADPAFILEELRTHLETLSRDEKQQRSIPKRLLGITDPTAVCRTGSQGDSQDVLLGLNAEQRLAVNRCTRQAFHFVWGPPGTGKTRTLARVVRELVNAGERVLLLAGTNAAVDRAMLQVVSAFSGTAPLANGQVLRYGAPELEEARHEKAFRPETFVEQRHPELMRQRDGLEKEREGALRALAGGHGSHQPRGSEAVLNENRRRTLEIQKEIKAATAELVAQAFVLGTTLARSVLEDCVRNWSADAIAVDEAGSASFPFVLLTAARAHRRLLLFGDFRQLPPICLAKSAAAKAWLGRDTFEIAGVTRQVDSGTTAGDVTILEEQYRMAPAIAKTVGAFAYNGRLRTSAHVSASLEELVARHPRPERQIVLLDTSALTPVCAKAVGSDSRMNPLHAALAVRLLTEGFAARFTSAAFISPYVAQARLVNAALRDLPGRPASFSSSTVHRFQGSESDLVVFDLVDAPPQSRARQITGGGLDDSDAVRRLLATALSRPRAKLFVLAHLEFARAHYGPESAMARALGLLLENGVLELATPCGGLTDSKSGINPLWFASWDIARQALCEELSRYRGGVLLNLPERYAGAETSVSALALSAQRAGQLEALVPFPRSKTFEDGRAVVRLLPVYDGALAALGSSVIYIGGTDPEAGAVRVEGARFVRVLLELLGLKQEARDPKKFSRAIPGDGATSAH